MPVILLSTHNQELDPPEERSSRLPNLSIGVLVSLHVIPTENTFRVPDFCSRCWEQEREPYGSVVIFILFEIVLTTEKGRQIILAAILFSNPNQRVKTYFEEPWVLESACQNCV